jgi:hypothetical protein
VNDLLNPKTFRNSEEISAQAEQELEGQKPLGQQDVKRRMGSRGLLPFTAETSITLLKRFSTSCLNPTNPTMNP